MKSLSRVTRETDLKIAFLFAIFLTDFFRKQILTFLHLKFMMHRQKPITKFQSNLQLLRLMSNFHYNSFLKSCLSNTILKRSVISCQTRSTLFFRIPLKSSDQKQIKQEKNQAWLRFVPPRPSCQQYSRRPLCSDSRRLLTTDCHTLFMFGFILYLCVIFTPF